MSGFYAAQTALPYSSGDYYLPDGAYTVGTGAAAAAGTLRMTPGYIRAPVTISSLTVRIGTAAASGLFQISVYAADPATNKPTGVPLYTSASQSTTSTGALEVTGMALSLPRGLYYFAVQVDATGATAVFNGVLLSGAAGAQLAGMPSNANLLTASMVPGFTKTGTFGTWPTLTGNATTDSLSQATTTVCAAVAFKVA